ncbi:hypothetical protein SAMN05660776_2931 [Salegentibacter holothuriorum]|uniref:Uncharacterized protein n=1 Tax=Salegentibacter holothuriorum TaxID=241145 RepID=A0A1T5E0B3_9FLAO|nr:hypothetical protein [Salegentibacter holothuriorum]SKB77431.1 hypothetical protein SAMN05660776_2931 [Salegentibacter holothuriorum]
MGNSTKIDWEEFRKKAKNAASTAAAETNEELAGEMSSFTHLTKKEIQEIFPEKSEMEDFSELMEIVKSSTTRNNKLNKIVANSEKFSKVMLSLLDKII